MAFDWSNVFGSDPLTGGPSTELGNLQVAAGGLANVLDPESFGNLAIGLGKGTLASSARAKQDAERKALMSQLFQSFSDPSGKVSALKMDPKTGGIKIDMSGEEAPGEGSFGGLETPVQAVTPGVTPGVAPTETSPKTMEDILANFL